MDEANPAPRSVLRFEGFTLDLARGLLLDEAGHEVPLRAKSFALLRTLALGAGRTFSKDELLDAVWPGVHVTEDSLFQCVREVRRAVRDPDGRLLRTIPRQGYLLDAAAEIVPTARAPQALVRTLPAAAAPGQGDAETEVAQAPASVAPAARPVSGVRSRLRVSILVSLLVGAGLLSALISMRRTGETVVATAAPRTVEGPVLAVLPFENLSGDPSQDYFATGITQEIVAALSRFRELTVLGPFAGRPAPGGALETGRQLRAPYVLTGGVRRGSEDIRVTALLIDTRDGRNLWAESYERPLTPASLFAVQDEVAKRIGASIGSVWTGAVALSETQRSRPKPPDELSSYECVLLAFQANANQSSDSLFRRARNCLESTVTREPTYAAGWAMLANTLSLQRFWGTGLDPPEADNLDTRAHLGPRALAAADRAVELAPDSPLARFSLARGYFTTCQRENLVVEAERTLALNPNDPTMLGSLGNLLGSFPAHAEHGRDLAEKALALVPTGHPRWWWWVVAKVHYRKGEFAEALDAFGRSYIEQNWLSQIHMAYTLPYLGRIEDARGHVTKLLALRPRYSVRDADRLYAAWCYDEAFRNRVTEGLRQAGLPE